MSSDDGRGHRKIVLRMKDGEMRKCSIYTQFSSAFKKIKVVTVEGKIESVDIADLKAIFFVKDFAGNPDYKAHQTQEENSPKAGKVVKVIFADGEVLRGRVLNMAEERPGFYMFPLDPRDNNEKVYIVRSPDMKVEVEGE